MSLIKEGFIDDYPCMIFSDSAPQFIKEEAKNRICVYLPNKQLTCFNIYCGTCPVRLICAKNSVSDICNHIIDFIYPDCKNDYPELYI